MGIYTALVYTLSLTNTLLNTHICTRQDNPCFPVAHSHRQTMSLSASSRPLPLAALSLLFVAPFPINSLLVEATDGMCGLLSPVLPDYFHSFKVRDVVRFPFRDSCIVQSGVYTSCVNCLALAFLLCQTFGQSNTPSPPWLLLSLPPLAPPPDPPLALKLHAAFGEKKREGKKSFLKRPQAAPQTFTC